MKLSRIFKKVLLFSAIAALLFSPVALAGNPGQSYTIGGPEYWGVLVADCTSGLVATLRVKKIENCEVKTEAEVFIDASTLLCPLTSDAVLSNPVLSGIKLFEESTTPIITKVKNHRREQAVDENGYPEFDTNGDPVWSDIYSMDVQIRFLQ
jgi:hypothetical protein